MKHSARRLAALESRLAALRPPQDQITLEEWRQWEASGVQPDRWRKSAAIQAYVAVMQERSAEAEEMLALLDGAYPLLDGDA